MPHPVVDTHAFQEHGGALGLHVLGLEAELHGDYPEAHAYFDRALVMLDRVPPTVDVAVQSARIQRDDGFTYARSAIKTHDPSELDRAEQVIEQSSGKTLLQVIKAGNTSPGPEPPLRLSRKQSRELRSEHGSTMSLMGRLATIREVVFGERDEDNPPEETFDAAHDWLRQGSNGYYRVSNAMAAARQERINKHPGQMRRWLARAAMGIAWSATFDQTNLKDAARTFGSRLRHVRSYQAAVESVSVKP